MANKAFGEFLIGVVNKESARQQDGLVPVPIEFVNVLNETIIKAGLLEKLKREKITVWVPVSEAILEDVYLWTHLYRCLLSIATLNPVLLEGGMEIEKIMIPSTDSEFLESQTFQHSDLFISVNEQLSAMVAAQIADPKASIYAPDITANASYSEDEQCFRIIIRAI